MSVGLPLGRDSSGDPSGDCVGFVECRPGEIKGRHCRLESTGETLCESLRLRFPWAWTWVYGEFTENSGMSLLRSTYALFWEAKKVRLGKDSCDVGDNSNKVGEGETGIAEI